MGSITSHPQPSPIQDLIANGHLAPAPKQQRRQSLSKNNKNTEEECPICFTSVRQSELNITQCCNHKICTNCFTTLNYTRSQDSWIATCPFCVQQDFGVTYNRRDFIKAIQSAQQSTTLNDGKEKYIVKMAMVKPPPKPPTPPPQPVSDVRQAYDPAYAQLQGLRGSSGAFGYFDILSGRELEDIMIAEAIRQSMTTEGTSSSAPVVLDEEDVPLSALPRVDDQPKHSEQYTEDRTSRSG